MPRYKYTARDKSGKRIEDYLFADNENDLADKLSRLNYVLVSSQNDKLEAGKAHIRLKTKKVLSFTLNLNSLLKGGNRLLESLNVLIQDTTDEELSSLVIGIRDFVEAGGSLADAVKLYPNTFSKLYIAMVEAGEKTGKLAFSLEEMANYLEWQADLRSRIKELATYPIIIFAVMLIVVSILVGWVLPKFEPILADLGTQLPLPTKIVLGISHFFTRFWYILAGLIILLVIGVRFILKFPKARFIMDGIKIKLPVVGNLIYKICIARFCRTMALGLSSGIGIIENLDLGKEVIGNKVLSEAVLTVKESAVTGGQLYLGFALTKVFPSFLVRMVEVGERSGSLPDGFKNVYEYYDKEIPRIIKQIFTLLEPLMIVLMGILVGGIALSVFLPLVKMTQSIGG